MDWRLWTSACRYGMQIFKCLMTWFHIPKYNLVGIGKYMLLNVQASLTVFLIGRHTCSPVLIHAFKPIKNGRNKGMSPGMLLLSFVNQRAISRRQKLHQIAHGSRKWVSRTVVYSPVTLYSIGACFPIDRHMTGDNSLFFFICFQVLLLLIFYFPTYFCCCWCVTAG